MQRYTIEEKLGEGGMGVVFRARQTETGRLVAIKYLQPDGELTETGIARFKREMSVLMGLTHPNIIKVFDAGEADGKLFYVMEMVAAPDLAAILRDRGALPSEPVASVLAQVLDALSYIHANKLIHRDIKPANIMLEDGGRAILMDFGLVRKVDGTMLTAAGKLLGTPRYFPPEYIRGGDGSPGGDVWSLGVSAYELLTGARPFNGAGLPELALAICKSEPAPLAKLQPGVHDGLARVVHRMLEKDPAVRYRTAAEALAALREAMQPKDLERSAELSAELSEELRKQLEVKRPPRSEAAPRTESRTAHEAPRSRVTGKRPRVTAARVPTVVPAGPHFSLWPAFVIALCVIAAAGIWQVARGRPDTAASLAAAIAALPSPADPEVGYESPERLVVSFRTPDASVWKLDCGDGLTATDVAPTSEHRLAVAANPMRSPEKVVLTAQGRVLELHPPASPSDRVRGLEQALANMNANEKTTDNLWHQIRSNIPEWQQVSTPRLEGGPAREDGASPQIAQRAVRARPDIALQFNLHVKGIREDRAVRRHLDAVLAMAPSLLMSEKVPDSLRDELLSALFRLDLVDALGEYMGLPPPFAIQERLRPALQIESTGLEDMIPIPPQLEAVYAPPPKSRGIAMHAPGENFLAAAGGRLTPMVSMEPSLIGWDSVEKLDIASAHPAGPGGRRMHFWVQGLSTQLLLYVVPEGYRNGFAVRLRGTFFGLYRYVHLTATVRGPLARSKQWRLSLRRVFIPASRLYYGVTGVAVEPLSR